MKLILLLLAAVATMSGCASLDNSMASNAVDIPNPTPLSEQTPVLTGTTAPAPVP